MINPEIIKLEGLPVIEPEGCLSVKDMYGKTARYPKVKFRYLDRNGRTVEKRRKDFSQKLFSTSWIILMAFCM